MKAKELSLIRKEKLRQLVRQMKECQVFKLIWVIERTSRDLVVASADIFKKLAQEQILDDDLMRMFWQLTKDKYLKNDVFRILTETTNLEEKHLAYIVEQIESIRINRDQNVQLSELELKLLADNNSFRKSEKQKPLVVKFFWSVLKDSDQYNAKMV